MSVPDGHCEGGGVSFFACLCPSGYSRPRLAAQLCAEFKEFFPNNAVEYFVSYYDYYQPEAYIPHTDTYIAKDASTNEEIDRLRLSAVSALLSGRKDVVVVSSVSCIYGERLRIYAV